MKYVKFIPVLLLGFMAVSCNTTKKLYENQEYDQVIQRVVPEIHSGKYNNSDVEMLAASYHRANQADHLKIQALKESGKPEAWPEIYQRYCAMKGRNDALKDLSPALKKDMDYGKLHLDEEIITSRNKAESFLVAKCNVLLDSQTKEDAEEAEKYIAQLRRTNPENSHIQDFRLKALLHSSENVLIQFENEYKYLMPDEFETEVRDFDADEFAPSHANFYLSEHRKVHYDLLVTVVLEDVVTTPERTDAVTFKETLGDKTAEVTDKSQSKSVTLKGHLRYYDVNMGCDRFSIPFEVTSSFKQDFSTMNGDREACSQETLRKINEKAVPFPTEDSMLIDAAKQLNDLIANELKK